MMKTLNLFITAMVIVLFGAVPSVQAQTTNKTESFKVLGNCEMCKDRIEKAVKEEGATSATWDQKTKMLTLSFNPSKSSVESFAKKVALVGHDTENFRADDKVYNALPDCCKYDRTAASVAADYTCPMHSDVHSDKPGKCPKCGMALVKKETKAKSGMGMHGMH